MASAPCVDGMLSDPSVGSVKSQGGYFDASAREFARLPTHRLRRVEDPKKNVDEPDEYQEESPCVVTSRFVTTPESTIYVTPVPEFTIHVVHRPRISGIYNANVKVNRGAVEVPQAEYARFVFATGWLVWPRPSGVLDWFVSILMPWLRVFRPERKAVINLYFIRVRRFSTNCGSVLLSDLWKYTIVEDVLPAQLLTVDLPLPEPPGGGGETEEPQAPDSQWEEQVTKAYTWNHGCKAAVGGTGGLSLQWLPDLYEMERLGYIKILSKVRRPEQDIMSAGWCLGTGNTSEVFAYDVTYVDYR